jgi:hypothetical protein
MELEGLKRSLNKVEEAVVNLEPVLTTDGHVQIEKWLRDNKPKLTHYLDVWHVAKSKWIRTSKRT